MQPQFEQEQAPPRNPLSILLHGATNKKPAAVAARRKLHPLYSTGAGGRSGAGGGGGGAAARKSRSQPASPTGISKVRAPRAAAVRPGSGGDGGGGTKSLLCASPSKQQQGMSVMAVALQQIAPHARPPPSPLWLLPKILYAPQFSVQLLLLDSRHSRSGSSTRHSSPLSPPRHAAGWSPRPPAPQQRTSGSTCRCRGSLPLPPSPRLPRLLP